MAWRHELHGQHAECDHHILASLRAAVQSYDQVIGIGTSDTIGSVADYDTTLSGVVADDTQYAADMKQVAQEMITSFVKPVCIWLPPLWKDRLRSDHCSVDPTLFGASSEAVLHGLLEFAAVSSVQDAMKQYLDTHCRK